MKKTPEIVIIGAGITGLVTALRLSKAGFNVIILESSSEVGGLLGTYKTPNYEIERFYHHILPYDNELIDLIKELGLSDDLIQMPASVGNLVRGRIYPLNNPLQVMRYPYLSFQDKCRLFFLTQKVKSISDTKILDKLTAQEWLIEMVGHSAYQSFFYPLLLSKFGGNFEDISAAWIAERVKIRSDRSFFTGEKLSYLKRGFGIFLERILQKLEENKVQIFRNSPVIEICSENGRVVGVKTDQLYLADHVVSTLPSKILIKIGKNILPTNVVNKLALIDYQHSMCLLLSLKKSINKNYWVNITDKNIPFRVLIEHTNFYRRPYGDEHLVYLATYFKDNETQYFEYNDSGIFNLWFSELKSLFNVSENDLNGWKLSCGMNSSPIYKTGYLDNISFDPHMVSGLSMTGMMFNYPERSLNEAVKQANKLSCHIVNNGQFFTVD